MSAPWLADVLRSTGEVVVEEPFWRISGRPGPFAPRGVLIHHTGTASSDLRPFPTRDVLIRGRSDLPGPLCQVAPDYLGRLHVIAAGRANHAGKAKARGAVPAGDGNALYIGLELDYSGYQAPSPAQYRAAVRATAAILRRLGLDERSVSGHNETSVTGKWDPGKIVMDKFRSDVRSELAGGQAASPEEDDVANTQEDLVNAARVAMVGLFDEAANRSTPTGRALGDDLAKILLVAKADPAALASQLAPLLGSQIDQATVERAVRTVLGSLDA